MSFYPASKNRSRCGGFDVIVIVSCLFWLNLVSSWSPGYIDCNMGLYFTSNRHGTVSSRCSNQLSLNFTLLLILSITVNDHNDYRCLCGSTRIVTVHLMYTASGTKEAKVFFMISPTKLGQFWWNLVDSFLSKFAAKWYKHFSPHLNNVSTLPCETWNAHWARDLEFLQKDTPEFITP